MKHILKILLPVGLSFGLLGCSNPSTETTPANSSVEAETNLAVTEITWEDLMPEGEDELLESLYVEFYEEFERKMAQNSTTLAEAASQETDMSSLIEEGSDADTMNQIGTFNVVKELNGQRIRVPGYVVPFDFNANSE